MTRSVFLIPFITLSCILPSSGQTTAERIDSLVKRYYEDDVFNGVVLVARKGQIIYQKAYGLADRDWNIPNTVDTKFRIASISKPFTALLILQLAEEGKITLDGTIRDYIPDYKGKSGDSITIHQLLTHTSGLITSLDPEKEAVEERLYHDLRQMISFAESEELYFKPGTRFRYSNFGYYVLAYIVEKVTGKRFDDVLQEMILKPAGMYNTRQSDNSRIETMMAKGYEYKLLFGYQNSSPFDDSYTIGPGGLISTADDLYLFDRALYKNGLLSDSNKKKIFTSSGLGNYGYGWFINRIKLPTDKDTLLIADHSGSINGFGSYMARILRDSSLVIVLKNQRSDTYIDPAFAPDIGKEIISVLYGGKPDLHKKSIARHLGLIIGTEGIDNAIKEYHRVKVQEPDLYRLDESELNRLGIELLFKFRMKEESLKVFELNMLQFPDSYNTYDSYAYVLREMGDYKNSVRFYRQGLDVLKSHPEKNDSEAVRKDSEQARTYIKDMEEKLKKR